MKDGNLGHWNTAKFSISDCKEFMPLINIWLVNLPDLDQADFDLLGKIKWENTIIATDQAKLHPFVSDSSIQVKVDTLFTGDRYYLVFFFLLILLGLQKK